MRFEARVFQLPKDLQAPEDYQDSWRMDAGRGIAVIADGVSSGIFSGPWARLLTQAVVERPPDPGQSAAFVAWLGDVRRAWSAAIPCDGLNWSQRAKLRQGAFSTLLWLQLAPWQSNDCAGAVETYRLTAFAAGDSCLFHLREGRLLRSFPLDSPQQFDADPMVLGSVDLGHDANLQWARMEDTCRADDTLVLCTDAVARWWLACHEKSDELDWRACRQWTPQQWQESIVRLREERQIPYDDCTVLLLRILACEPTPEVSGSSAPEAVSAPAATAVAEPAVLAEMSQPPPAVSPSLAADPPPPSTAAELLEQSGRELAATGRELVKRLGVFSEQLADHLAQRAVAGWRTLAESTRKHRQRFSSRRNQPRSDEPPPPEQRQS